MRQISQNKSDTAASFTVASVEILNNANNMRDRDLLDLAPGRVVFVVNLCSSALPAFLVIIVLREVVLMLLICACVSKPMWARLGRR